MSDDRKEGLAAAVEAILAKTPETQAGALRVLRAEQLALIPSAAELALHEDPESAERAGPGRPPGSRNRRTDEWVRFISARYRDPRLFLAEAFNRPAAELAAELGCDRLEAFKLQLVAAKELAPFMAQKQPIAVQVQQNGEVRLTLVAPERRPIPQPGDGAKVINARVERVTPEDPAPEENQSLSAPPRAELDKGELDK